MKGNGSKNNGNKNNERLLSFYGKVHDFGGGRWRRTTFNCNIMMITVIERITKQSFVKSIRILVGSEKR